MTDYNENYGQTCNENLTQLTTLSRNEIEVILSKKQIKNLRGTWQYGVLI